WCLARCRARLPCWPDDGASVGRRCDTTAHVRHAGGSNSHCEQGVLMRRLFFHRSSAATVIALIALLFAMGGTTVAATGASAAVAAAAGWSIQATPNPTGGSDVVLNGVSCTSASACTAVGGPLNRQPPG